MMTIRLFRNVLLCCVLLALFTVSAAQTGPRTVRGDNVEAPVSIMLNQKKTINGVEAATRQDDAIEAASCDPLGTTTNSVWFAFEAPTALALDLDTGGSIMSSGDQADTYVTLTVYTADSPLVTEVACAQGEHPRVQGLELAKGLYKVRLARPYSPLVGPSRYRLGLRARLVGPLGQDPEFVQPLGTAWKVRRAGNPAKIYRSCADTCVRFDGVAGGKIVTNLNWSTQNIKAIKGDLLTAQVYLNDTNVGGAKVKLILQLYYSDGTPSNRATVTRVVDQPGTGFSTTLSPGLLEIRSKALSLVKLTAVSPQATDTFSVTYATITLFSGSNLRGLLPVPPAP
jgi:hypothetical protein